MALVDLMDGQVIGADKGSGRVEDGSWLDLHGPDRRGARVEQIGGDYAQGSGP